MSGLFVTIEGVEGAGKSTLVGALVAQAQPRHAVLTTFEPGDSALGRELRRLLLHGGAMTPAAELLLYAADRAEHVAATLRPALQAGRLVLCDRYSESTIAYQGYGRGLDLDMVTRVCRIAEQGLRPDLVLLLDVDPGVGLQRAAAQRGRSDRIESEALAFHERVRAGFLAQAQADPQRTVVLDGAADGAALHARAWAAIAARWDA